MQKFKKSLRALRGGGSAVIDQDTAQREPLQEPSNTSGDEVSETSIYPYQPLQHGKHIRLLYLSSDSTASSSAPDDLMSDRRVIYATLKSVELNLDGSSPQTYRALSYEWGPPPEEHTNLPTINLDGHTVPVRQNLYDALKAIVRAGFDKSGDAPMPLWVDALCNNQSDDKEKGHQVELMRDIFAAAETVLVWLGRLGEEAEEAMKIMSNPPDSADGEFFDESLGLSFADALSRMGITTPKQHSIMPVILPRTDCRINCGRYHYRRLFDGWYEICRLLQITRIKRRESSIILQENKARAIFTNTRKVAMGLAALCCASYWRRVWIIQEFVAASDYVILCGNYFVTKRRFEKVLDLTVTKPMARGRVYCSWLGFSKTDHPTHRAFWSPSLQMISLRETKMKSAKTRLAEWVRLCLDNKFRATEPRDYVYALLGISDDCTGKITPDYTKSARGVLIDAAFVMCPPHDPGSGAMLEDIFAKLAWIYYNRGLCEGYAKLMGLSYANGYVASMVTASTQGAFGTTSLLMGMAYGAALTAAWYKPLHFKLPYRLLELAIASFLGEPVSPDIYSHEDYQKTP